MSASSSYDPNKLGWGAALITVVFTAALGFSAWTIHKNTYRHPRDPMNVQVYHDRDAGGHAAPAGGEHAPAAGGEHATPAAAPAAAPAGESAAAPAKH
ncbi:MAG: hypothetical protein LCH84_16040 [Gemmatimonadetes bacterium]|nr:hypothetical protein [Gemmatimonadota bacterium]